MSTESERPIGSRFIQPVFQTILPWLIFGLLMFSMIPEKTRAEVAIQTLQSLRFDYPEIQSVIAKNMEILDTIEEDIMRSERRKNTSFWIAISGLGIMSALGIYGVARSIKT